MNKYAIRMGKPTINADTPIGPPNSYITFESTAISFLAPSTEVPVFTNISSSSLAALDSSSLVVAAVDDVDDRDRVVRAVGGDSTFDDDDDEDDFKRERFRKLQPEPRSDCRSILCSIICLTRENMYDVERDVHSRAPNVLLLPDIYIADVHMLCPFLHNYLL